MLLHRCLFSMHNGPVNVNKSSCEVHCRDIYHTICTTIGPIFSFPAVNHALFCCYFSGSEYGIVLLSMVRSRKRDEITTRDGKKKMADIGWLRTALGGAQN